MSLNENYIISGSTLSDIGDALRNSGILTPAVKIEPAKVLTYNLSFSDGYYNTFNTTVAASNFAFSGKTPTAAKVFKTSSNNIRCNNKYLTQDWGTADTYSFPLNLTGSGPWTTVYGVIIIVPLVDGNYIVQDNSITLPSQYSWSTYEGAGKSVPNLIQVSDIATLLNSPKQYQIYTADSSVTTGENIHYQAWTGSGYGGLTMPRDLNYDKMVFCHIHYSNSYDFTYVRDLMPYIANSDKSQIFFPCFYTQIGFPTGNNIIKTRTLRNSNNPYVANGWYGIGYRSSEPTMLTAGGVKLTAVTEGSITLQYNGGLGGASYSEKSIVIFEK